MAGDESHLPWERLSADQASTGVGICVSGGGLRAAMFGLGVLQVLQERHGLLFGPNPARYLAAVSGGSYISAAFVANAYQRVQSGSADDRPPVCAGSPEEAHILGHGMYLVTPLISTIGRFGLLFVVNALALVALYVWAGFLVADVGAIFTSLVDLHVPRLPTVAAAAVLIISLYLLVRSTFSGHRLERYGLVFVAMAGIVWSAPPVMVALSSLEHLRSIAGWWPWLGSGLAFMAGSVVVSQLMAKRRITGLPAAVANWTQVYSTRVFLLILLLYAATVWFPFMQMVMTGSGTTEQAVVGLVQIFGTLLAPVVFDALMHRFSLHREYRDRIRSCFGVVRSADGQGVSLNDSDVLLSELGDGRHDATSYPSLLISATTNVRNKDPRGKGRGFGPFVLGHDVCGVPGTGASFDTEKLELGRVKVWRRTKEPLITLFTAIATTGAAVSPSMGRYSQPSARPILAAANIRLGRWIPNMFHPRRRALVESTSQPRSFYTDKRFGESYDQLICEITGVTNTDVYLSDGGHYDNLGLMALLRARCAEIWCVDASPDPHASAEELHRVLDMAAYELGATNDVDLSAFAGGPDHLYGALYGSGTVTYTGGQTARLHIVKLGLSAQVPEQLRAYALEDKGFPHHSTALQWYPEKRSTAYRDLGRFAALGAMQR